MNNQAYDDTATRNPRKAYTDYENSTYTVVSKVAYLVGVQKRIFENEYEPPKMEWYEKLHADKNARIVRNLCMIRTALELNFKAINNRMRFDMCNLHSLPEYVPQDSLNELLQDGITIVRSRALPAEYIVDINKHISNRINNCKSLFPLWLKWEYVRKLFLMPDGLNKKGIKAAAADYYANKNIKVAAVLREVRQKLDQAFHLNVRDILDEACRATRADMTTAEKNQFYDKYIKTMHVDISPNGEATIVLGK